MILHGSEYTAIKPDVWKYIVRRNRFFGFRASGFGRYRDPVSKCFKCVCLTSLVLMLFLGVMRTNNLMRVVVVFGKAACNTFCPADFYENPLYYYDGHTPPAVVVFGNIFPIVRFLSARTLDDEENEKQTGAVILKDTPYIEYVTDAAQKENENKDSNTGENTSDNQEENTASDNNYHDSIVDDNYSGNVNAAADDENREGSNGNGEGSASNAENSNTNDDKNNVIDANDNSGSGIHLESIPVVSAVVPYSYEKLVNFNFVHDNFYVIPSHTALSSTILKPIEFLETDLSVTEKKPCILIYHTHSQEAFADSDGSGMTIVQVGDYLEQLLEERYGFDVIHITTEFDMIDGKLDRSKAYTYAEQQLTELIRLHPEIDMVIDLHRDGVNDNLHFVTDINGKPTAKVMLFNGISYSNNQGEIDYLYNPYLEENLALTYQMYLLGKAYYPDFFRCIYIEAYRYNLHLCKRSMLIEAGAQTNSFEEVKNAMEPLSELIARELNGERIIK